MQILLDTCTFLWMISGDGQLSKRAERAICDPENEVFLSAASCWEIAVKYSLGKLALPDAPAEYIPQQRDRHGVEPLTIGEGAALIYASLPDVHRDPFDRILVCQALDLGLILASPDPVLRKYPAKLLW